MNMHDKVSWVLYAIIQAEAGNKSLLSQAACFTQEIKTFIKELIVPANMFFELNQVPEDTSDYERLEQYATNWNQKEKIQKQLDDLVKLHETNYGTGGMPSKPQSEAWQCAKELLDGINAIREGHQQ